MALLPKLHFGTLSLKCWSFSQSHTLTHLSGSFLTHRAKHHEISKERLLHWERLRSVLRFIPTRTGFKPIVLHLVLDWHVNLGFSRYGASFSLNHYNQLLTFSLHGVAWQHFKSQTTVGCVECFSTCGLWCLARKQARWSCSLGTK